MLAPAFTALTLLPDATASVEAAHDLGLEETLRGRVFAQVAPTLFRGADWGVSIEVGLETWFRENDPLTESPVRLSPHQIRYPVAAHLRFDLPGRQVWGVFALHQSNHDVDVTDERLNRETLSFEVYGAEWRGPDFALWGGMIYDRGTTLAMRRQSWPFDYSFATLHGDARQSLWGPVDASAALTLAFHRNGDTQLPHVRVDASADVGATFTGDAGALRPFLRWTRLEDYQHLGDAPRQVLMLGLAINAAAGTPPTAPRADR